MQIRGSITGGSLQPGMAVRRRSSKIFQPQIGPTLSEKETQTYLAMIEGKQEELKPLIAPRLQQSVVVVGAGLAGLAAAREFAKAGLDVILLEAEHRAGGRCFTMVSKRRKRSNIFRPTSLVFYSAAHILLFVAVSYTKRRISLSSRRV